MVVAATRPWYCLAACQRSSAYGAPSFTELIPSKAMYLVCCRTLGERVINVLTSLPFSAVGLHMLRQRRTRQGRRHGGSLVAVGAMAALYHASFGRFRGLARKLDYWTISWSAVEMVRWGAGRVVGGPFAGRLAAPAHPGLCSGTCCMCLDSSSSVPSS